MCRQLRTAVKNWFRSAFFPGVNLHARERYHVLPRYFLAAGSGKVRRVLDAGSGNGMLAYKSYLLNNEVVGVSFSTSEVEKATAEFNQGRKLPKTRLEFRQQNLYALDFPPGHFDEIICSEVIEHLRQDVAVCSKFFELLKPGGILHLCAPNAHHPYNATFPLDTQESGGHVRPGYTYESYRALLEPIGFRIAAKAGLGGPVRQAFNRRIKNVQARFGAAAGIPLFFLSLLFLWLDRVVPSKVPFSLYVTALKPSATDAATTQC
jgi:SAM-dependent methyltransferase